MDLESYQRAVGALGYGKRLPNAHYIYLESGDLKRGDAAEPDPLRALVAHLVDQYEVAPDYNLLKFRTDELKISFLAYPEFITDPHPVLRKAISINAAENSSLH